LRSLISNNKGRLSGSAKNSSFDNDSLSEDEKISSDKDKDISNAWNKNNENRSENKYKKDEFGEDNGEEESKYESFHMSSPSIILVGKKQRRKNRIQRSRDEIISLYHYPAPDPSPGEKFL
jgi:hypothetical protein